MSNSSVELRSELEAIERLQQRLRRQIGAAGLEQKARFAELELQVRQLGAPASGSSAASQLEQASRLAADLRALSDYLGTCWSLSASA